MPRLTSLLTRVGFALLSLSLTFAVAHVASAQEEAAEEEAPDPRLEEARVTFEGADAHFAAHRYVEAAEGFRRAYDLLREAGRESAPMVWFNVASAYDRAHRTEEAIEAYQHFVDEVDASSDDVRQRVATARARIVELRANARPEEVVVRPTPDEPPAPVVEPTPSSGGGISPIGPILMGGGGALLITGFVLGGVALAADGDFGSSCPTREACDPALRGQYDDARTMAVAGDVLWIVGAAVAATGLVLTLVLTEEGDSTSAAMSCGPTGCSAQLAGSF